MEKDQKKWDPPKLKKLKIVNGRFFLKGKYYSVLELLGKILSVKVLIRQLLFEEVRSRKRCRLCDKKVEDLRVLVTLDNIAVYNKLPRYPKYCDSCWEFIFDNFYKMYKDQVNDYFKNYKKPANVSIGFLFEKYDAEFNRRYLREKNI